MQDEPNAVTIGYPDLVRRLVDLERLCEPPRSGELGAATSSYDRSSRYDAETDTYVDWDANADGSGFVRREGEWVVAFEEDGPGVIWRIHSALPGAERIQIFIDDADEPVVDMPFRDFFERFNDETPPLNFPSLVSTLSRGRNRFIPIPYGRSCKIRILPDGGDHNHWGSYYHFTHTTFPADTALPSFDGTYDRTTSIALATADRALSERGWRAPNTPDTTVDVVDVAVPPGATVPLHTILGNRAITAVRAQLELPESPSDRRVLRELALSIRWDGEEHASVWSPLGDFFGSAPGATFFRTLPVGATDGGFYAHWFMPFAESAELLVTNDGDEPRTLRFAISHRPLERPATELLRFHAKWHRNAFQDKAVAEGRGIDWPLLITRGTGRFCGVFLHIWNPWDEPAQPPASWWYGHWDRAALYWWWGEGDEKFFVDGERFPSTFGIGSEDYFGHSWAAEPPFPTFDSPYAAQPYVELNANGHTSLSRFHICDDIPFQDSFEGYIERYKTATGTWEDDNPNHYAAVAYWYLSADGVDPYRPVPISERLGYFDD
jgi:hypothetical protein